jgi:hypothetical protein
MLRPRVGASAASPEKNVHGASLGAANNRASNGIGIGIGNGKGKGSIWLTSTMSTTKSKSILMLFTAFTLGMLVQNYFHMYATMSEIESNATVGQTPLPMTMLVSQPQPQNQPQNQQQSQPHASDVDQFQGLVNRALLHQQHCQAIGLVDHEDHSGVNNHTAHLTQFGILEAVRHYQEQPRNNERQAEYPYTCALPPETECEESQFTVIFMAYNPDRLQKLYNQIHKMLTDAEFAPLVREVVVVWNGERHVDETTMGQTLVDLANKSKLPVRISYPLLDGFPNDLMNRYHPRLQVTTKAIMYYDDDGPFYSYKATLAGFELWKRNANAQIGAMARKLDISSRQVDEKSALLNGPGDRFFVSHCPTDALHYNFNEFAQFGANMVLPSGSFLHANYLCFLWHPIFAPIRDYVRDHPVNPDDGTVSVIVSQLAGRAPKVYSRRINESTQTRRLQQDEEEEDDDDDMDWNDEEKESDDEERHHRKRRRLMDGINWDGPGGANKKQMWGQLRSDAANSLTRYFGSINSGSIGWCYGTPHQEGQYCKPDQARVGQLPWLTPQHTARAVCP